MTTPIDWQAALDGTRPVTTRHGRKVTLYCIDAPGFAPVYGRIEGDNCVWAWKKNGAVYELDRMQNCDLIQAPKRIQREYWVNVCKDLNWNHDAVFHETRASADHIAKILSMNRLACVPITIDCEEGEGL